MKWLADDGPEAVPIKYAMREWAPGIAISDLDWKEPLEGYRATPAVSEDDASAPEALATDSSASSNPQDDAVASSVTYEATLGPLHSERLPGDGPRVACNPRGRTGWSGRGLHPVLGPNHVINVLLTRSCPPSALAQGYKSGLQVLAVVKADKLSSMGAAGHGFSPVKWALPQANLSDVLRSVHGHNRFSAPAAAANGKTDSITRPDSAILEDSKRMSELLLAGVRMALGPLQSAKPGAGLADARDPEDADEVEFNSLSRSHNPGSANAWPNEHSQALIDELLAATQPKRLYLGYVEDPLNSMHMSLVARPYPLLPFASVRALTYRSHSLVVESCDRFHS